MSPRNGLEVIGAMRYAHPSRELRTLAFTLSSVDAEAPAARPVARAVVRVPGRFKLTRLPTNARTGQVRDRQRLAIFERGRRVAMVSRVDLAQLLVYDVFTQPLDSTIMWLDSARVRFALAHRDELDGRSVWVVGAADGDLTSPQFWVDDEQWRVVRVIQRDPRRPDDVIDVRFSNFAEYLTIPVPMRVTTYRDGKLEATQELSRVSLNPNIPPSTFDLARWTDR